MIIAFTGLKGSGKDTAAAYLVKQHGFERRAFGDPLKQLICGMLGISQLDLDQFKREGYKFVFVGYEGDPIKKLDFRDLCENTGQQNADRTGLPKDHWIEQTLPVDGFYAGRSIVVTDVRFVSEAERVIELGGIIIKVIRYGQEGDEYEVSKIPAHFDLYNAGTIEQMWENLEGILNFQFRA